MLQMFSKLVNKVFMFLPLNDLWLGLITQAAKSKLRKIYVQRFEDHALNPWWVIMLGARVSHMPTHTHTLSHLFCITMHSILTFRYSIYKSTTVIMMQKKIWPSTILAVIHLFLSIIQCHPAPIRKNERLKYKEIVHLHTMLQKHIPYVITAELYFSIN